MTRKRRAAIVVTAFLLFCAALVWRSRDLSEFETRTFVLPSGFAGTEIALKGTASEPVAILFHGLHCNRVQMTPLARYLAHAGMRVFLLDSPGHGDTGIPFDEAQIARQSEQAFREMVTLYGLAPERTSVIGHSYGSVGMIAVASHHPSINASVFIGPGYYGGATPEIPRNALMLTAEHDHRHIFDYSNKLFAAMTNGAEPVLDRSLGDTPFVRLWRSVPGTSHVGLLVNQVTFSDTLAWVRAHTGSGRELGGGRSTIRSPALAAAAALLLFVAVVSVIPVAPTSTQAAGERSLEVLLILLTTPLAAFLVLFVDPLTRLRILEGSGIVSMLAISGLMASVATRRLGRSQPRIQLRDTGIAAGYFALLYVLLNLTVTQDFYDLSFTLIPARLVAFAVFSACGIYFFLVLGGMLARLHGAFESRRVRMTVMAAAVAVLSFGLPLSVWLIGSGMWRFYGPIALVFLFISGLMVLLLELYRNSVVASVLGGLVVGWIISIGFAFT